MATKKKSEGTSQDKRLAELGKHIKNLRIKAGYTSYENFAIKHEINRMTFYRIEAGSNVNYATLLKVIDGLDMTVENFFKGLK